MGCGGSKDRPDIAPITDLTKYDKWAKFELSLPFYRMYADDFEGRVKRYVNGKETVSLRQLQESFKGDSRWEDLENEESLLVQCLRSEYLRDDDNKEEINLNALLLLGILLCAGDPKLKVRIFYDILQDNLQPLISATDKDFKVNFFKLMELATKFVYEMEPLSQMGRATETKDISKIDEDVFDTMKEEFLDEVYGTHSKMER